MDVTCDNCKAEYDFDDTLLGDKGTTVKCSKCGHVFRVLPPRREPTRSALKVRFRDGHVESLASLRELQQRIQAGAVSVDDELGRDGFNFRRLGDVPELRNFFAPRPASAPASMPAAGAPSADLPHRGEPLPPRSAPLPYRGEPLPPRAAPKSTVLGVGSPEVPKAPRVPNFGPAAAHAVAQTQPAARNPKGTLHGRAPISSAPTAPNMAVPGAQPQNAHPIESQRVLAGAVPANASATAPTLPAAHVPGAHLPYGTAPSASQAPTLHATVDGADSTQPAVQAQPGPALHVPAGVSENPGRFSERPAPMRAGDSIGPGALRAAAGPRAAASPTSGRPVRLAIHEDERPQRTRGSSSAVLWGVVLAAVLGVAWVAARQLLPGAPEPSDASATPPGAAEAPAPETQSAETPSPAPTGEAEPPQEANAEASPEGEPQGEPKAAPEPPAKAEAPVATQAAPEPARKPSAPSAKPAKPNAEPQEREKPPANAEAEPSGSDPKSYAGWVSRGEKLLARREYASAQSAFEQAVQLRGTGSEANSGLGTALLAQNSAREAIPYLQRAASNGFAEANVGLGDAYRKLGQKDAAVEAYETYLARLPKGTRAAYVRLQLEGLGSGPAKPERSSEPSPPSDDGYRPAGELVEQPPPGAADEPSPAPDTEEPLP